MRKTLAAGISLLAAALTGASFLVPFHAHAEETPYSAFCADNAVALQRTMGETSLDPATWASDPDNLARFGYSWPNDIDTLYQAVIEQGAPYITSRWSNLTANVQWRCSGQ